MNTAAAVEGRGEGVVEAGDGEMLRLILAEINRLAPGVHDAAQALSHIRRLVEQLNEKDELIAQLEQLAVTDGLTGLANKRHFEEVLKGKVAEAQRGHLTGNPRPVSVILIDLDHFKSYNDVYGHQAGDELLVAVGQALLSMTRAMDTAARWGGEELAVVLTGTEHPGAKVAAEKIRVAIAEVPARRPVTASVGVCSWEPGATAAELVHRADQALYGAKRTGRNRVRSATEPLVVHANGAAK